ncbi:hypothetical protein KI387_019073, partial [Taxus chinensis]
SEIEPHIVGFRESLKRSLDVAKGNAIEKVVNVQLERAASGKNLQRRCGLFFPSAQINLKGLDGIQGPVYVGTGCVFNRTALYGYDPPLKQKSRASTCLSACCGGDRKKNKKVNKKHADNKNTLKQTDSTIPIFNLEDLEEGVE